MIKTSVEQERHDRTHLVLRGREGKSQSGTGESPGQHAVVQRADRQVGDYECDG